MKKVELSGGEVDFLVGLCRERLEDGFECVVDECESRDEALESVSGWEEFAILKKLSPKKADEVMRAFSKSLDSYF